MPNQLPAPSTTPRSQNHLFVSYSSKDRAFVDQLAGELRKRGYVVWMDFEGIHGGERWRQSIADGLHASLLVLLVLSPESIISEWVEEEIRTAFERGKTVIPLLLRPIENISQPALAEAYKEIHYRDFTGGFQLPFEKLLDDLPPPEVGVPGHCQKIVAELASRPWGMEHYIREEAKLLPVNASPYEDGVVTGEARDLQGLLREKKRLIILGEPGIGKTVALERLAWELASAQKPTLPILIKLLEYDGQSLLEWVRLNLIGRGEIKLANQDATRDFLNSTPFGVYFLLDGLNEVPPDHRQTVMSQITRLSMEFPQIPLMITSRVQDESWRVLQQGSLNAETVLIQPIKPAQIQTYLHAHLEAEEGERLWRQLEHDQLMSELATTPLLLWLIKEAWLEARRQRQNVRMPENRGELYQRFIERMLKRDDLRQLNKKVSEKDRLAALEKLALYLHERETLTLEVDHALAVVGNETVLAALRANGLLIGEKHLRFAPHQTVQEHFAARALLPEVMTKTKAGFLQKLARQTLGVGQGILKYATEPWWAETFIQLAGLTDDPNALAMTLAESNPWLAWWCVQEGRKVDEATRQAIESKSMALVNSSNVVDRRRAAQTLSQLATGRVFDPLAQLSFDADESVVRLALPALWNFGEDGEKAVLRFLMEENPERKAAWGRAIADIDPRKGVGVIKLPAGGRGAGGEGDFVPDIDWVEIPAGEFIYQNGEKIHLDTYWMSRYPITYVQFQTFVDAPDGIRDDRWWVGLAQTHKQPFEQQWKYANHPRENVNWYQAIAFCRWLSWRLSALTPQPPLPQASEGELFRLTATQKYEMTEIARRLRREATGTEEILWSALRNRALGGRKFRRQHPIGAFVVDFYCAEERLVVEVDGSIHQNQQEADMLRQALLEGLGLRFVRVTADEVQHELPQVLAKIERAFFPSPASGRGAGVRAEYDPMNPLTWLVRLPTEQEWEKAARDTDGRIYPYGNDFDAAKGNTKPTGIGQTSAVGMFPQGASPYGLHDMSGNVWEWCLTEYKSKRDDDLANSNSRVVRGGSWFDPQNLARAVFRYGHYVPYLRDNYLGLRVVCGFRPS